MKGLLLLVLLWGGVAFAQEFDVETRLRQQDFNAVIQFYEDKLQNAETLNSADYYHLGISYFYTNQNGKALLHYLQAWSLNPREELIVRALSSIFTITQQPLEQQNIVFSALNTLESLLSLGEQWWLSLVIWSLIWGLLIVLKPIKTTRRVTLSIALLVFITLMGRYWLSTTYPIGVTLSATPVYTGQDTSYLQLYTFPEATLFRVIEKKDQWSKIELLDGRTGWVSSQNTQTLVDMRQ